MARRRFERAVKELVQLQQDTPGGLASQYLDTTQGKATTAIPFIDHGTRKVKENIDLYMSSGMVNQSLVELLAQHVLGLELAREEKLELMEPLGRQFPMVMQWMG
jgi:hypothetical protein